MKYKFKDGIKEFFVFTIKNPCNKEDFPNRVNKDYFCGKISTNKLKKKINNQFMSCKWKNKDRYKRFIAECFKGKTNINAWMVRYGYAVAYRKYSKKYVAHEDIAKRDKLGLWAGTFEMPWDYRKKN